MLQTALRSIKEADLDKLAPVFREVFNGQNCDP